MRLYDSEVSGNCYKVRLLLSHLGLSHESVEIDVVRRDDRERELGDKTPLWKVPVLELDDGRTLAESGAILWYLARDTPFLDDDPLVHARTLQWMFFEQNNVEPNIAVVHYWVAIAEQADRYREPINVRRAGGHGALAAMQRHLVGHAWFSGERYGIADVALYGYTHLSEKAGFALASYPAVRAWHARVEGQPGFVPMRSAR